MAVDIPRLRILKEVVERPAPVSSLLILLVSINGYGAEICTIQVPSNAQVPCIVGWPDPGTGGIGAVADISSLIAQ